MYRPQIRIVEQPAQKSFRFRYESEGRASGPVLGAKSTRDHQSFPKIEIRNFTGTAVIHISCVTNDKNEKFKQHPHKLSSTSISRNKLVSSIGSKITVSKCGVYKKEVEIHGNNLEPIEFNDIGMAFIKKENIKTSLTERKAQNIDPTNGGWAHIDQPQFIDLHCVRLCFSVYEKKNNVEYLMGSVISNPIMDKKSHGMLKIVELSSKTSSVMGGERVILLCDKVKREDIAIVFYEENAERDVIWKKELNYLNSKTIRVHHQHAISFDTPQYREIDISESHKTFIQLYRPSDHEVSAPFEFTFVPTELSIQLRRKRHKKLDKTDKASLNSFTHNQTKQTRSDSQSNKPLKSNYMPNIFDKVLAEVKQLNVEVPNSVNPHPQPLIDIYNADQKENVPVPKPIENQRFESTYQTPTRQYEMPYTHYPYNNTTRPNDAQYYYPPYTQPNPQHQNVNNIFDDIINAQPTINQRTMYILPNVYPQHQHQHQHQQQSQPQSHAINAYGNNWTVNEYNAPHMNTVANHSINPAMPVPYNNDLNVPSNKIVDNLLNTTDTNMFSLSDYAHRNTNELCNEILQVGLDELADSIELMDLKK